MKKSKLYGSRLIEDNEQTITPELVTLESIDDVTNLTFDRGNILDASSVKQYQTAISDDLAEDAWIKSATASACERSSRPFRKARSVNSPG